MLNDSRPRIRRWLMPAMAAVSVGAAGLYGLLPFSYAYFQNTPFFRYFPGKLGQDMQRTTLAALYERAWAVTPAEPFVDGDITCQFYPATTTSGCVRPLQPGLFAFGPSRSLPEGTYRATIKLDAAKTCSGVVHADVISANFNAVLAGTETTIRAAPTTSMQMDFPIDPAMADRAKIDVRVIQTSGQPCVVLKAVHLVRRFL